jgi:glycosyltransferase involved in cell wall biosynthesis
MTDERLPRVLLLAMYRLDRGQTGPVVRIEAVREALSRRVSLDVVSGARTERATRMLRYALGGRLRRLAGVYVESSSALPGPADLLFLALARALGIPVLTYIRDAYQLFPEYYPITSPRRRISRALFLPLFRTLARLSSVVAFPSRGLASAVLGDGDRARAAALLPPGARLPAAAAPDPAARSVLYVGSLARDASGGDLLLDAVGLARERCPELQLICVAPEGQAPREPHPTWLKVVRGGDQEILGLLPRVLATVTPRPRTPYNDLAIPVKVMEYLGYSRPLIVTDAPETAAIVEAAGCGVVVPGTVDGLADGLVTVCAASATQIVRWGDAARRAAAANSWDDRAQRILNLLGVEA